MLTPHRVSPRLPSLRAAPALVALLAALALPACAAESPGGDELRGPGTGLEDQEAPPNVGDADPEVLSTPSPGEVELPPTVPPGG